MAALFTCLRPSRAVHPDPGGGGGGSGHFIPTRKRELKRRLAASEQRNQHLELELKSLRTFAPASAETISGATKEAMRAAKEAKKADAAAAKNRGAQESQKAQPSDIGWSAALWIDALKPISQVIADALLQPLCDVTNRDEPNESAELAFVRAIGKETPETGVEAVLRLLRDGPFLMKLAQQLYDEAAKLAAQRAATAAELQAKFMEEAAFTLAYGGMDTFFGGLERLLGPPSPSLLEAMRREHCSSSDSKDFFTSANYGITVRAEQRHHARGL